MQIDEDQSLVLGLCLIAQLTEETQQSALLPSLHVVIFRRRLVDLGDLLSRPDPVEVTIHEPSPGLERGLDDFSASCFLVVGHPMYP